MVYSGIFFELWVPSQNSHVLHVLTILSVQAVIVSGAITALNNVFVITNNLKVNSIFWIIISFIDVGLVAFLLKFTNLGVYAVAGVSTFVGIIANLIFVPLYACHCLKVKWNTFYGQILRYTTTTILILFIVYIFNKITNLYLFYPISFAGIYICLYLSGLISKLKFANVFFDKIGNYSYEIMGMHFLIFKIIDFVFAKINGISESNIYGAFPYAFSKLSLVYVILGTLVPVGLFMFFDNVRTKIINKIPLKKLALSIDKC